MTGGPALSGLVAAVERKYSFVASLRHDAAIAPSVELTSCSVSHMPRRDDVVRAPAPRATRRRNHSIASGACALVAWLAALLVAGAPIAKAAHFLLVPHSICEHGELVHAHLTASTHPSKHSSVSGGESGDEEGGLDHEHCVAVTQARVSATSSPEGALLAVLDPEPPVVLHPCGASYVSAHAILFRAPKTSPPRA